MSEKRKESLIIFVFLAVLSVVVIYSASHIPVGGAMGQGADFLPRIIGWLVALCAAGFLLQGIMAKGDNQPQKTRAKVDVGLLYRFGMALGLLIFYVTFLRQLGFVITSVIYIYAQTQLMVPSEKRSHLISAVIAIVSSVTIYAIFVYALSINLPSGLLPRLF